MQQPDLILVDGSSYIFRAFYVPQLRRMQSHNGQPTGAIFGTVNMIKSLAAEYPEAEIAVIFDAKGKSFRNQIYAEYKANRPPMPDELRQQIPYIHNIIKSLGYPLVMVPDVEADDVIGTYAKSAAKNNKVVYIASSDKDLAQVVSDHVLMIDTMKKVIYDIAGVEEKYGVRPDQIVDYLALMGDSSDNVPGVPKVGPKTAVKWLQQYGSLQSVVDNADQIGGKVGENLRDFLPQLPLSKELVTLRCDLELDLDLQDLKRDDADNDALVVAYKELQFNKWLTELGSADDVQSPSTVAKREYTTVLTQELFLQWLERLQASPGFAFDTETTSLDAQAAELVGVSFSVQAGEAAYVPVAHNYLGAPEQLSREWVLEQLKPILENPQITKIGQNIKYDMNVLANYDIDLKGAKFDTMLESYVINSVGSRHDMDSLSRIHLGHQPIAYSEVAGSGKAQITFDQVSLETAGDYAAEDADITLQLHHHLMPKLLQKPALHRIFTEFEMPLVEVLARVERNGVKIDAKMLAQQSAELDAKMRSVEEKAFETAGAPFNLASPKQIQEILYDKMGLPVLKKTPKGAPSTAEDVLHDLAQEHDLPRLILEYRSYGKLKSTYTDKLPTMINAKSGRVHTSYHQAVAATGRLSSADPNLQNIPIRTAEGKRIREAFIADKGRTILALDYSQIELRIMAHLSQDQALLNAFKNNYDVHKATAAQIFDIDLEAVTSQQRRHAKAVNFGLIYGMSAFGLAKQLKLERREAQKYIDGYFAQYPGVLEYMQETKEFAKQNGFVETVFGRRLYLPDINAGNHNVRQYAERTAINAPMQGTAADIIKLAMIEVDEVLSQQNESALLIMQVHDELVFEIDQEELQRLQLQLEEIMQSVVSLRVPLVVDSGIGNNWSAAH